MNIKLLIGSSIFTFFLIVFFLPKTSLVKSINTINLEQKLNQPNSSHIFGLDENGVDIFVQVLLGTEISLKVGLSVTLIGLIVGILFGSLAGYFSGIVGQLIMRLTDLVQSFPGFLAALSVVAVLGSSVTNLIIAMSLTSWVGFTRLIRAEVLKLKNLNFVEASKSMGANDLRLIFIHIFPNLLGPLLVSFSFSIAGAILTESGLSFLGLGAPVGTPSWGSLISSGRYYLFEAPHISLFPGLAIILCVLGFKLIGEGIQEFLNKQYKTKV